MNVVQVSGDLTGQEGGVVTGKIGRYSAEERKERIERYRSKRNQRNFQKKITYACRKTLADSRPRVRGRFARNGEAEMEGEGGMIERNYQNYEEYENCNYSGNDDRRDGGASGGGEWWGQMKKVLDCADEEEEFYCDNDMWVNFMEDLSVNLMSS